MHLHAMSISEPIMLLLLTVLGALSFSLHSDGLAVVAANPLGPDYVHADLGSDTNLQCPGILRSPTRVTNVSWFAGNTSDVSVQQDVRTSVDSAGRLVIRVTEQRDGGWYHCEYASSGSIIAGSVHLDIVEISVDMYVVDPANPGQQTSRRADVQGSSIDLSQNMVVIIDARSSTGDDLSRRNPYWLYNGENSAIRRPFFCYPGYVTSQGDKELRMVMLSTQTNYSGRWEFVAGGLRTYIDFKIADNGSAVKLLTQAEESSLGLLACDGRFSPMLVTHPPPTTTVMATPATSSPATDAVPATTSSLPAAVATSNRVSESRRNDGNDPPVTLYAAIGIGVLICICIVIVLLICKRRATGRKEHDKEEVPELDSEPPPRPVAAKDRARNHVYDQPIVQPKALEAMFSPHGDLDAAAQAQRTQNSAADGCDYDSDAVLCNATSPAMNSSIRSLPFQNSRDSLEGTSLQTPPPAFRLGAKAATLSHVPGSPQSYESYDSRSLGEVYSTLIPGAKQPNGSFERTRSARLHSPAFASLLEPIQNSCPMHRRCGSDASPRSTSRLLDRSDSPANIVLQQDGSPMVAHGRRPRSASCLARTSTVPMSPLLMTIILQQADSGDSFRGSANIVVTPADDNGSSPDSPRRAASNSVNSRTILVTDA